MRRRPRLWRELIIGLVTFAIYGVVAGTDWPGRFELATSHARGIFDIERSLHIDVEATLNSWLAQQDSWIRTIANYEYAYTYVLSAFLLLIWLYVRRPEVYRWARTSFVILNLIGISCFAAFPVTPPRLMPKLGFVDTVTAGHTFGSWGSGLVDHANEFAAMPSLHLAWALWVSVVLALISSTWRTQVLSLVHVLVTLFVILATANHYVLDAVGGAVAVWLSVTISDFIGERDLAHPGRRRRLPSVRAAGLRRRRGGRWTEAQPHPITAQRAYAPAGTGHDGDGGEDRAEDAS